MQALRNINICLQAGADANAKEEGGARPIDAAASAQQRGIVELLLPCTSPSEGAEWTIDAVMEAAAEQQHHHQHHQHQHDGCCGCSHDHEHEEEQVS